MSRAVPEGGVRLGTALASAGRGEDGIADILLAILDGRVPLLRIDPGQRRLKCRFVVDRLAAHDHLTTGGTAAGRVSVVYAARAMGLKEEAVRVLCAHLGVGMVWSGRSLDFSREDLDRIRAKYMTLRATAASFGLESRAVRRRLMDLGVFPALTLMDGRYVFYDRRSVERRSAAERGGE